MTFTCTNCLRDWPEPFCDECGASLMPARRPVETLLKDLKVSTAAAGRPGVGAPAAAEGGKRSNGT